MIYASGNKIKIRLEGVEFTGTNLWVGRSGGEQSGVARALTFP